MNTNHALRPFSNDLGCFVTPFFNSSMGSFMAQDFVQDVPAVNISETETTYHIDLAAPGLEKSDFSIQFEKDQLRISVKKEVSTTSESEGTKRQEFNYSSFERAFTLPKNINTDAITAQYENGILAIELVKYAADIPSVKTIEIE